MIRLQFPEFLLLAIPLIFVFWRWGHFRPAWVWLVPIVAWAAGAVWLWTVPWWAHLWLVLSVALYFAPWLKQTGVTGFLRLSLVALLLLAMSGPEWDLGGNGIDVIVVADRSRSMPPGSEKSVRELIRNIETNRRRGDQVAVVTFGATAAVEHDLSGVTQTGDQFLHEVSPDASDLNEALLTALDLVDRNRPARILVLSDGESTGAPATFAARRAREAGVPIDYRLYERLRVGDVAIRDLSLPEEVDPLEPFQFSVEISSDRNVAGTVQILRDGEPFVTREVNLLPGLNRVPFRDVLARGGMPQYEAVVTVEGDPLPENNRGQGIVRVVAGPRLLVLNSDGERGNLVRELESGQIAVDVAVAEEHPLMQDSLDGYRAVIIENVPANALGRQKMERLAQFVEDLGGGLMLTGGQRSFGAGGYFKSPLDAALPVSMEMREEHRKTRVAIAIALDRSGSMAMPVSGGQVKMDLANLGTAEVIRLLSPGDSVAVIAIDSSPHIIQPLTDINDPEEIAQKVLSIESLGGGIFVYEALVAAGREVSQAEQATKHIILFSDANDSEEPGDYKNLLKKFEASGITVSVIGLGTAGDADAKLLEEIALLGRGNIMFTDDAKELPRLFAEDTMSVARSSFVQADPETQPEGIPGSMVANAQLMGGLLDLAGGGFPTTGGYNLSYLKPEATLAVKSNDEYDAPWSAFWYHKLGRVAALTLEVDGQFSGSFGQWANYDDFLITHARWLLGEDPTPEVYIDLQRVGQNAVLTVELDPDRPEKGTGARPEVVVLPPGEDRTEPIRPELTWIGPDTLQTRFRLEKPGTYRTMVVSEKRAGEKQPRLTRGPAVTLPYSPEFDPRHATVQGRAILDEVAELSGGVARTDVLEVLSDPPRSARSMSMLPVLFATILVLLVLEIAGRRLSLWETLAEATDKAVPTSLRPTQWMPRRRERRRGAGKAERASDPVEAAAVGSPPAESPERAAPSPRQAPTATPDRPVKDIFAAAKDRARRRTK